MTIHGRLQAAEGPGQADSERTLGAAATESHSQPAEAFPDIDSSKNYSSTAAVSLAVSKETSNLSTFVDTFDLENTAAAPMPPPAVGAPVEDHMDFLQHQLDSIGMERPILNGLLLLGSSGHQRLQGGALFQARVP